MPLPYPLNFTLYDQNITSVTIAQSRLHIRFILFYTQNLQKRKRHVQGKWKTTGTTNERNAVWFIYILWFSENDIKPTEINSSRLNEGLHPFSCIYLLSEIRILLLLRHFPKRPFSLCVWLVFYHINGNGKWNWHIHREIEILKIEVKIRLF